MSGPEMVARIRASHPGVKVIFMSGHTPEIREHGGTGPGTMFLQKPFEIDESSPLIPSRQAEAGPRGARLRRDTLIRRP